jgi:hypothetical protein
MREADDNHPIEQVGRQLRAMMPWSEEGKNGREQARTGENRAEAPILADSRPFSPIHASSP